MSTAVDGLLGRIPKSTVSEIRISLDEYRGFKYLSIREFYDDSGQWKPTRKGCTIPLDSIPAFLEAVEALKSAVEYDPEVTDTPARRH